MSEYMNFESAYRIWCSELDKLGCAPENLFAEITISLDEPSKKAPQTAWWIRRNATARANDLQQHLNAFPNTCGPIHYSSLNATTQGSAANIWDMRSQPKCVFAYLMCASLFNRLIAVSGHYPEENWGKRDMPRYFYDLCDHYVFDCGHHFATNWTHFNSTIVPHQLVDDQIITDEIDLISFMAKEHAELIRIWQVTNITFTHDCTAPA